MHWQSSHVFTSIVNHLVRPRITLILAIDTQGNIFTSLMHMNSNTASFGVFLIHLVEKLDLQDFHWRKITVIQLDGASYHKTTKIQKLLKIMKVPYIISSPYSYHSAAAEFYFSLLKRGPLNSQGLKIGKSKYLYYSNPSQKISQL